jgi:protein-tyrosine phosphatase
MARPAGGARLAGDLNGMARAGVDLVLSLLPDDEVAELALEDEPRLARAAGLAFRRFPIPDFGVPPLDDGTFAVVEQLAARVRGGQSLVIHCRMGVGRSSLVAASVLAVLGVAPEAALAQIQLARGCPVPDTAAQRAWVLQFAADYAARRVVS